MTTKYNPYQVICIGEDCKAYNQCGDKCVLKSKLKKFIKGCNYNNVGDCTNCSNKKNCVLIKPYSDELNKVEMKRHNLESENKKLFEYIDEWDEIENHLDDYEDANSVFDVIYFKRSKQQMIDRISDNEKLIKVYLEKEKKLMQ